MQKGSDRLINREKANALVSSIGRNIGVYDASLNDDNDRSFGEFGFHYYPDTNVLAGRVYLSKAFSPDDSSQVIENFRKVAKALNDPKIGGMFEHQDGYFVLDEDKRMIFLVKDFDVATTTSRQLRDSVEDLLNLGATWSLHWLARVARITHGREPAPTEPVTRKNLIHRK